jgi:hypothetical protein
MNRRNLIALVGSVAFVLFAFWIVTLLFPGTQSTEAIIGKWRVNNSPKCDEKAGYLIVTKDEMVMHEEGKAHFTMFAILDFEASGDDRTLHVYAKNKVKDADLRMSYEVVGDKLTFGPVDWTPEARAKYPEVIAQFDALGGSEKTVGIIRLFQPFTRCPA